MRGLHVQYDARDRLMLGTLPLRRRALASAPRLKPLEGRLFGVWDSHGVHHITCKTRRVTVQNMFPPAPRM